MATWAEVLDELEQEARREAGSPGGVAGSGFQPDGGTWVPPSGLGPLPAELAGRAREVLTAQREATATLRSSMTQARRHDSALAAVPAARSARPVYLDVTA